MSASTGPAPRLGPLAAVALVAAAALAGWALVGQDTLEPAHRPAAVVVAGSDAAVPARVPIPTPAPTQAVTTGGASTGIWATPAEFAPPD